jgi:hypothetical protein
MLQSYAKGRWPESFPTSALHSFFVRAYGLLHRKINGPHNTVVRPALQSQLRHW